jgi:hypothetical protein
MVGYLNLNVTFSDIAKYNTDEDMEESIEETGWKLVHGDVFRPPQFTRLFVAILGSGVQVPEVGKLESLLFQILFEISV